MIHKDDDTCPRCIRRRRKECGFEPEGFVGPDSEGEYDIACKGRVTHLEIRNAYCSDVFADYNGIGDPIPFDLLYPIFIWAGMNWLDHTESEEQLRWNYQQQCKKAGLDVMR